jgi:hypothetical protein
MVVRLPEETTPKDYYTAVGRLVEKMMMMRNRERPMFLVGYRGPEPATHFDPRMHLTLRDMPSCPRPPPPWDRPHWW